jgi:hypothetical protein
MTNMELVRTPSIKLRSWGTLSKKNLHKKCALMEPGLLYNAIENCHPRIVGCRRELESGGVT